MQFAAAHESGSRGQRVEVRVVLHAQTAPTISETCRWIARNLPFVDHVALMGLENTGFAIANEAQLWIDPIDYQAGLADAVDLLVAAKVNVSVYNLQRCVLARSVWPYAVQSISDWKKGVCCRMRTLYREDEMRWLFQLGSVTAKQSDKSGPLSGGCVTDRGRRLD
jgi:hypothetical protein